MLHVEPKRSFADAFSHWFSTAADLHGVILVEPCTDHDAVDIKFWIGDATLHGYADAAGISVSASLEGECWDFLFERDLLAAQDADGWHCTLCPEPDRPQFDTIQRLLDDHLFCPLHEWITTQLLTARAIGFFGDGEGGMTWATLIANDRDDDPPAHIVQLTRSTACPYS